MIRLSAFLVAMAAAMTMGAFYARQTTLDRANHRICVAIQNINVIVTAQLTRSKQNLPKLTYFQQHPDELRSQVESIDRQLAAFRPRHCH